MGKLKECTVKFFTDVCKKCGFSFTYKSTKVENSMCIQMRLHMKKCDGKQVSKDEMKKISIATLKTMKTVVNNTAQGRTLDAKVVSEDMSLYSLVEPSLALPPSLA